MPNCPKCGKEIDHLREWDKVWRGFDFTIGEDGLPDYDELNNNYPEADGDNEWECPECNTVLFYDQERAIEFLKGVNHADSNRG